MPKSKVLKSLLTVTGFSVLTRSLAFLFKIYLSRTLGAETLGLYQMALTVFFLFIALSTGGISTVLSRKIAEMNTTLTGDKGLKQLSSALFLGVGTSLICLLVAYLSLPYMGFIITDERAIPLLKIMLPALISTTFYIIIRGWFWGNKYFLDFSLSEFIEEILRIILTILFISGIISGINGEVGVAVAFLISDVVVMVVVIITFLRRGGKFTLEGSNILGLKAIVKPALPLTLMKIFGSFAGTAIALVIPAGLVRGGMSIGEATASVGRIAGMANPLIFAPNAIISALNIVLVPEMSESNAKGDLNALKNQISTGITTSLVISGGFMLVYLALGKELTSFLYGDLPSGLYLEKASLLLLLAPINHTLASTMNSIGKEKENFITYSFGSILMLIASIVLPKYVGIESVIVADLMFSLTVVIGNSYYLRKHVSGGLGILKPLFSVIILALSCSLLAHFLNGILVKINVVLALLSGSIISFILYFLLAYFFKVADLKLLYRKKNGTTT